VERGAKINKRDKMKCAKCGTENGECRKCCYSCGSFLEGWALHNVTGEYGYRTSDGYFLTGDKANKYLIKETK